MQGDKRTHITCFRAPRIFPVIILALAQAVAAPPVPPDAEPFELRPAFLNSPPAIDGVLDEPAWQAPPLPLGTWISYNPLFGEQAPQQTQVWVAYDKQNIYFAFRCLDPEPDKIKSSVSRRDSLWNDDWVGLSLDAIGGGQNSYDMFVNPDGVQGDIFHSATAGESSSVDWVWQSAGRRTKQGFDVEIRLPLRSIRFTSGAKVRLGVLFWRRISRMGVSVSWPSLPPGRSFFTRFAPEDDFIKDKKDVAAVKGRNRQNVHKSKDDRQKSRKIKKCLPVPFSRKNAGKRNETAEGFISPVFENKFKLADV